MNDQTLTLHPIGRIRTSFANKVDAPRQPAASTGATGVIELFAGRNLEHAIEDLSGWERIWVIFWFDRNTGWRPKVLPPRATSGRKGVLSTRSPHRPNPLGLSVLRLARVEGLALHVLDVDLLDGTPILDIKPYVPYADAFPESGSGWLSDDGSPGNPGRPGAADPGRNFVVTFSADAEAQLAWIAAHSALPLRERILNTLMLGPQPHPYRRIRRAKDGGLTLAVQDWRVDFSVDALQVAVHRIRSGYNATQLARANDSADDPLALHRAFTARLAPAPDR